MCGCEATFTCSRCQGTPDDWRYLEDAPLSPAEEQEEWLNRQAVERWEPGTVTR